MEQPETKDSEFERLALCHLADVTRFARALARNEADADDLVQDTFLLSYRQWHQFIPGSECRAWLFAICRNRFYRVRARAERQVAIEDSELEDLAAVRLHDAAERVGLGDLFEHREVMSEIADAMRALPDGFRDVAILIDLHDYTYESAAAALGVKIGTVRSRLFRARRMLQEQLLTHAQDIGLGQRREATTLKGALK